MKKAITLIAAVLIAFAACRNQDAKWTGTISVKQGVSYVENPSDPIFRYPTIVITEKMAIGDPGSGPGVVFQHIPHTSSVTMDRERNLYVLDYRSRQIFVFDPSGKFVRKIGGKGQGPGEFQAVGAIRVLPDDQLAVYDSTLGRLSQFSSDGSLISMVSNLERFLLTIIDSDGNLIGTTLESDVKNRYELKKLFVENGKIVKLSQVETSLPLLGDKLFVYARMISFDVLSNNHIVWGTQEPYRLHMANEEGALVKVIDKKYEPILISDEDRARAAKDLFSGLSMESFKIESPRTKPAFSVIRSDELGYLYVRTSEQDQQGRNWYDIFDPEGRYLSRFAFETLPILIEHDLLYLAEETDDGSLLLKIKEIKWPMNIKKPYFR